MTLPTNFPQNCRKISSKRLSAYRFWSDPDCFEPSNFGLKIDNFVDKSFRNVRFESPNDSNKKINFKEAIKILVDETLGAEKDCKMVKGWINRGYE